jgi:predicted extracellular nuclease
MSRLVALGLFLLVVAGGVLAVPAARSASPDVVVSQVYAGGGNAGAPFANDFVELFNRGAAAVDVSGWTIQYASASGTTWQATALSGSIPPGRHYLVQLASAGAVGAPLPTPDATGTTNLAVSGGKVAVVRDTVPLTCGGTAGSCSAVTAVADLVGYGGAVDFEGSGPAPAIDNTTASARGSDGCTDTDVNATDFAAAAPAPRNLSAAATTCSGSPPPSGSVSQSATVDVDVQSALSIALERSAVSFGSAAAGTKPAAVSEKVTVVSNNASGYTLTVRRTAFVPADLPLGIAGTAPAGGQIGGSLAGGAMAAIPIPPTPDLLVGTTAAPSAAGGDLWDTRLGFVTPLPVVPAGRYSAQVTFTVIGR